MMEWFNNATHEYNAESQLDPHCEAHPYLEEAVGALKKMGLESLFAVEAHQA